MSSLRNSYNRITKPYPKPDSGFIQYNDDEYNSSNVFVIPYGTTSKIPNNAASMLGNGIDVELYDGSVITPEALNDSYILRVNFTAFTSVNSGGFSLEIDISETGNGSIIIANLPIRTIRGSGSGSENALPYSIDIPFYCSGTFLSNGGHVLLEAEDGNVSIYDISFVLFKIHGGQ